MNKDQEFELNQIITDLEKEIERYPGMGVSNYDFLRLTYFLKSVFQEKKEEPVTSTTPP
jgi:hypothetical protein